MPRITRGTDKGLPQYRDTDHSDDLLLSGVEELVPALIRSGDTWISKDNITTIYGQNNYSRIFDPADPDPHHPRRVFSWLICESYDDKSKTVVYEYKAENSDGVDTSQAHERNRTATGRSANRYLKRIRYGSSVSRLVEPDLSQANWMFEVLLDYGE